MTHPPDRRATLEAARRILGIEPESKLTSYTEDAHLVAHALIAVAKAMTHPPDRPAALEGTKTYGGYTLDELERVCKLDNPHARGVTAALALRALLSAAKEGERMREVLGEIHHIATCGPCSRPELAARLRDVFKLSRIYVRAALEQP